MPLIRFNKLHQHISFFFSQVEVHCDLPADRRCLLEDSSPMSGGFILRLPRAGDVQITSTTISPITVDLTRCPSSAIADDWFLPISCGSDVAQLCQTLLTIPLVDWPQEWQPPKWTQRRWGGRCQVLSWQPITVPSTLAWFTTCDYLTTVHSSSSSIGFINLKK